MTLAFSTEVTRLPRFLRQLEADAGDPLDLGRGVDLGVDGALAAVRQVSMPRGSPK